MKLVDNASKWYKMFSQQAMITIASISTLLLTIPDDVRVRPLMLLGGWTVQDVMTTLTILTAVLGFIGRLVDQNSTKVVPSTTGEANV